VGDAPQGELGDKATWVMTVPTGAHHCGVRGDVLLSNRVAQGMSSGEVIEGLLGVSCKERLAPFVHCLLVGHCVRHHSRYLCCSEHSIRVESICEQVEQSILIYRNLLWRITEALQPRAAGCGRRDAGMSPRLGELGYLANYEPRKNSS
jgi:hypothetical protein